MPHVYGSIIDKETGKTRIEDVKKLYDIVKNKEYFVLTTNVDHLFNIA